jgi:Protein of unknown function (DUF2637)
MVAGVAAYSSYEHQRQFAAAGGAEAAGARLWPLSVDGLLLLASIGLLRAGPHASRRTRGVLWAALILGIAVSLAANIAAAPVLGWQPVLVAGWPPVALLLAVELLADHPTPAPTSPATSPVPPTHPTPRDRKLAAVPPSHQAGAVAVGTAEQRMWAPYQHERAAGRTPTGADLDRIAGTNNYGRAVLTRWRRTGQIPAQAKQRPAHQTEPRGARLAASLSITHRRVRTELRRHKPYAQRRSPLDASDLIVDVRGAARFPSTCRLQKQGVERRALALVECAEHLVLDRRERNLCLRELLRAGGGEVDHVPAAILG